MNSYQVDQVLNLESENGIWLDYSDHTWFFMIKDDVWQPEEIANANRKGMKISYIQKGMIDAFLISINDCLETSDVPLCLPEATRDLYNSFIDSEPYQMMVLLIDGQNRIKAIRSGTFQESFTRQLKRLLQQRRYDGYDERSYSAAYTKLAKRFEPYQLEEFALLSQAF